MIRNIGIGWQLHDRTGWGVYGINLALQLLARENLQPVLLFSPGQLPENPLQHQLLQPLVDACRKLAAMAQRFPKFQPHAEKLIVLNGLGNNFSHQPGLLQSPANAGVIFFENTAFNAQGRKRAAHFPLLITGSHWNENLLREKGFTNQIVTVIQGVDPTIFHPAPKAGFFGERFVIFSGGKLEYRKGQDIVIAAYKKFNQRHPESLLLCAWHNSWPATMAEIVAGGLVDGVPDSNGPQAANLGRWLEKNGLLPKSFLVLAETPNIYMAPIMREADVALFPNRGEGGTNLVMMEALACGLPVIMAANTGQLDFADPEIGFPLTTQGPVKATSHMAGVEGWGESDQDEILEKLEEVYQHRDQARERGKNAARRLENFTWQIQVDKLLNTVLDFFS
ncbi:MAG TPA: glycosyltransferase [Proteobacteria bacterium]|nr:glycosyltransferase [Pseudomonadota bacterium]